MFSEFFVVNTYLFTILIYESIVFIVDELHKSIQ